jgi:hypothetical protein
VSVNSLFRSSSLAVRCLQVAVAPTFCVGVLYPGYCRSPVMTKKSKYDPVFSSSRWLGNQVSCIG